jgi:hypothetical protein
MKSFGRESYRQNEEAADEKLKEAEPQPETSGTAEN